jgi:hypothetical protein
VFIVTRQQKDGWEGFDLETNEIVPEKSAGQQAIGTQSVTLQAHMHKGCTRDAQGSGSQAVPERPEGGKGGASPVKERDEAGGSHEQAVAKTLSRVLRPIPAPNGPGAVALALTRTGEFRQPD